MGERDDLLRNLRQLVELDRGLGVEFLPRIDTAATPAAPTPMRPAPTAPPAPDALPTQTSVSPGQPAEPPATPAPEPRSAAPPATAAVATPPPDAAAAAPSGPATPPDGSGAPAELAAIAARIAACTRCGLCAGRTRTVPGEGAPRAALLFVGEGPGADEDASGRPFVGAAGQLLTRMIRAMGLTREEVFIANVVKCRPPGNRTPTAAEAAACMPYLHEQIAAIRPTIICTLGNTPLRALLGDETLGITRLRGQRFAFAGIPLIPTFHPSYLLRNPAGKKPCWEDLQLVLKELGRTPPARGA